MSTQVETVIKAYKTLAKIPTIVGARLNNAGNRVTSKWSARNLDKGKSSKYLYNYVLDEKLNVISQSDFGVDVSQELLSSVSPNETFRAVIREEKDTKDAKKQYLEVWQSNTLAHSIDLNALDIHGDVYADSEFGCLNWSPDESRILYVAEKKLPKSEPFIKRKPLKDMAKSGDGEGETPINKGEEYVYKQDWGEQLVGKHLSVIVVVTLEDENFSILKGLPEDWCPGQVRFAPDGGSVVGVAWETEPRRLGLIFCTNRPGYIFTLDYNEQYRKISSDGLAVRSPRFNVRGDRLVWLQRPVGGPHHACHQLVSVSWPLVDKIEVSILIDIVQTERKITSGSSFYGIYSQALPNKCFTEDGKRIVFSTPQQTEVRSYVFEIDSGRLMDISTNDVPGSTSVLDVRGDLVLGIRSNMRSPSKLIVLRLAYDWNTKISWQDVSSTIEVPSVKDTIVKYMNLQPMSDCVYSFSAIYMAPNVEDGQKLPLIVWPHGGPHSNFVNSYSLEAAFFRTLGFACLFVNYRGSTGTGQATVNYLTGHVGVEDVLDCKLATDSVMKDYPIDDRKVYLFGGSHGGFLVTHLSGQYPLLYRAVVTRNPVTDVASMINSTDIADWCAVEAGFNFTETGPISDEQLLAMRRCSPLAHVHKVKAPTAVMLGSIDKRVPYYQGLDYYRRLKANGCVAKLFLYEDNHSLSSQSAEMDNLINSASWFLQHMN